MSIVDSFSPDDWAKLRTELFQFAQVPPLFLGGMVDYLTVNQPEIPASQVFGFSNYVPSYATVATSETTASTTYVDLATAGPTISGIPDGDYFILLGGRLSVTPAPNSTFISLSINGSTPADADGALQPLGSAISVVTGIQKTLSNSGSNTIKCQYRVAGGTGTFANRFVAVFRQIS